MTDWKSEEDAYLLPTYEKFPFVLARGKGCLVWDEQGHEYLDLYGGHAVCLLGHCPDEVANAVAQQAKTLLFYSNLAYTKVRAEAARALVQLCGAPGAQVFFCNSGAEANENAMRIARAVTGRPKIVATVGSFHGRTAAALAATGIAKYRKNVSGLGAEIVHVPFGDLAALDAALTSDVAGFILEPIQSMGGIVMPPEGYLEKAEALCRARGALLIFDEVQTGLGRVGAPSAAQAFGVMPQLQTFAKGLASGVPAGAVLVDAATSGKVKPGTLGSTFGGGPLACAAVKATLETVKVEKLWENALALEKEARRLFAGLPGLVEIRGKGLLLGLVFDADTKPLRAKLLEKRILVGGADDPKVVRLLPPLTVTAEHLAALRAACDDVLAPVGA